MCGMAINNQIISFYNPVWVFIFFAMVTWWTERRSSWASNSTICPSACTKYLHWIFTAQPGTPRPSHPLLTFVKDMKTVLIHCHFPLQHRCRTLAEVKINPGKSLLGHGVRPHRAPCLSLALLRAVNSLGEGLDSKAQRTTLKSHDNHVILKGWLHVWWSMCVVM